MIRYNLRCDKRHEFESWFANSATYDAQAERGLVACPLCGSTKVEKALMTPRLGRRDATSVRDAEMARESAPAAATPETVPSAAATDAAPPPAPVAMISPQEREFRQKLKELRDHVVKHAHNVGARFPEEARKMHYGETSHRSIYGIASPEDAKALHEEGIQFAPLPILPDDRN
jgi:hypothetical protein